MLARDTNSFDYQERSVAFIDVLGFAELVRQSDTNSTARTKVSKLIPINELFERSVRELLCFAEAAFFSDSFVLSVHSPESRLINLIRDTGYLCRYLLLQGFPCRGAITTGSLYHNGRFVVGPALVDASDLEKSAAIYPRIILDDETMAYWTNEFRSDESGRGPHPELEALVKRDRDGQHFLDIFNGAWASSFPPWTDFIPSYDPLPTDPVKFLNEARKQIKNGLATNSNNLKIRAKYEWLATECNEYATAAQSE